MNSPVPVLAASVLLAALAAWVARRAGCPRSAPWLALVAVSQAAVLQLTDAGSRLHYEHLVLAAQPPAGLAQWAAVAVLLGAAAAVAAGLRAHADSLRAGLRFALGARPRLVLSALALVWVATAAYPSRELDVFARELPLALALRALQLGALAVWLAALYADLRARVPAGADVPERAPARGLDPVVLGAAAWVGVVATLLVLTAYERHPHVTDEFAYLFHARIFASGQLTVPAPRVPEAFEIYLVQCGAGRCWAPTYPAWPAVLALGVALGVPWLVNPLLGALGVVLSFLLVRDLSDDARAARLTALLLALSPWYLLVSMSFMTHAFSLDCALVAGWGVARMARRRSGGLAWSLPAGLALGVLSLVRPLEALSMALLLGVATLALPGPRLRAVVATGLLALAALVSGSANLVYNRAMTGDPLTFPIMAYADRVLGPGRNALGFGPDKGVAWGGIDPFPGHGLRDAAVNAQLNATGIDRELFGWGAGSLGVLVLVVAGGRMRRRDGWWLAAAAATPLAHTFYWYSGGPDFAARYWYLSIVPLVALTARGLLALGDAAPDAAGRRLCRVAPLALSLLAVGLYLPWRAADKYVHFRGMRADVRSLLEAGALPGAPLVLVRGDDYPDAASAMVYNPLDPEAAAPLFVWARDAETEARLRAAYPDRVVRVLEGPTRTGDGYRLLPADDAAAGARGAVHHSAATTSPAAARGTNAHGPSGT